MRRGACISPMPTLKTFLPDVNVWLALASRRHVHSLICAGWLDSVESGEVMFCRVTQMGLLRLLTSAAVMGSDVISFSEAWRVYRAILADRRIQFAAEPFGLEPDWKQLSSFDRPMPKVWTDAYLAAFARSAGMQLVTLDKVAFSMARA